jgi:hypothetical protein
LTCVRSANIIIKQNAPDVGEDDSSSIYEIFNRLNTGEINLKPQEIRTSLYHSPFCDMLSRINLAERWRDLLGVAEPDLHMKDIEILLRAFAMVMCGDEYKPSMTRFLNLTSKRAKSLPKEKVEYLEKLFYAFLDACKSVASESVLWWPKREVNISFIDAVFAAQCAAAFATNSLDVRAEDITFIDTLFREQKELVAFLRQQGELSFSVNVEALLSKTLLLSVASFFETRITTAIADYAGRVSNAERHSLH